ncbi:hypothetical protein E2C01_007068 [Portunus trituberculatus]|uniref:Uncharacterized protein n=1 Tax=Portunus trituberculatus TaxID=210409 RepID=A0A5B7CZW0_PORTR|nr:hypothetical protein [Portunus trituberculatus]
MIEAGLYNYWRLDAAQNSSSCEREPTKITVSSSLSLRQCWVMDLGVIRYEYSGSDSGDDVDGSHFCTGRAMMVVLTVGLNVGLATLCLEAGLASVLSR